MDEAPAFFSYWLALPALIVLALEWVWDGSKEDRSDTWWAQVGVFVVLALARYLP